MDIKPIIVLYFIVKYISFFSQSTVIYDPTVHETNTLDTSASASPSDIYPYNTEIRNWYGNYDAGEIIAPISGICATTPKIRIK